MQICYIDESGTSHTGNTSHYVLAGISIPATQWKFCDSAINKLKKNYKIEGAEIHTAWLLRPYLEQRKIPKFESLNEKDRRLAVSRYRKKELLRLQRKNPKNYRQTKKNFRKTEAYIHLTYKQRQNLVIKLSEIVRHWDFARLFAECIDKIYFDPSYANGSIDEQALEQVNNRMNVIFNRVKRNFRLRIADGKEQNMDCVFTFHGEPVKCIKTAFRPAVDEAKIDNLRFHDLRHTFASQLLLKGGSLKDVQELLGHKTMTMTLRYAHLTQEHKRNAVNLLNDLPAPKPTQKPHSQIMVKTEKPRAGALG